MGSVNVKHGYSEGDQLDAFQNATLQYVPSSSVAMSIATTLDLPELSTMDQASVADYVEAYLRPVIHLFPELNFEVQVGYSESVYP